MLKQKSHFKMEKDKAQRSWDNSKRNLDEAKASMRERLRLKQEAERHRQAEIKVSFTHTFQKFIPLSRFQVVFLCSKLKLVTFIKNSLSYLLDLSLYLDRST